MNRNVKADLGFLLLPFWLVPLQEIGDTLQEDPDILISDRASEYELISLPIINSSALSTSNTKCLIHNFSPIQSATLIACNNIF